MTIRTMRHLLLVAAVLALSLTSRDAAALAVFACEPEWAALASELGGDKVEVFAATKGLQDPHQVQARPALIARLRNADLAICTGADSVARMGNAAVPDPASRVDELFAAALDVQRHAYAPYSNYLVGAAVRTRCR